MNAKITLLLAVILAALALLAKQSNKPITPPSGIELGSLVLEKFDVNAVEKLVRREGTEKQTLEKKDERWVVSSLHDYPADFSVIAQHVRVWAELKVEQAVYGAENSPAAFGLSSNSVHITLFDAEGGALGQLSLGNSRNAANGQGSGGHYVQTEAGKIVLTEGAFESLPSDNEAWIDKSLLKITPEEIIRISVSSNEMGYALSISNNTYSLLDSELPKGKQINPSEAGRLARALQYLSFSSIVDPTLSDEALGFDNPQRFVAEDQQGVVYQLTLGRNPSNDFVALRLNVSVAQQEIPTESEAEEQTLFKAQDLIPEMDERVSTNLLNMVTLQNEKLSMAEKAIAPYQFHTNWTYKLSSYSAEAMMLSLHDLLQDAPKESDTEEQ